MMWSYVKFSDVGVCMSVSIDPQMAGAMEIQSR